jgi:pyruvate kinase
MAVARLTADSQFIPGPPVKINTQIQLLKFRRTKIIATVGPSSAQPETLARMIRGGVNVFRLNFSHGSHASHRQMVEHIREASTQCGIAVAILADLCGPKIRVGTFPGGSIGLTAGSAVVVTVRPVQGAAGLIPSQYPALADDVRTGDRILLDDGNLELQVVRVEGTEIACEVIHGGVLKDKKGINLPGVAVSARALTDKDRDDAAFALSVGVDFLALSFVRTADDVRALRECIGSRESLIIAKIEKPEALENIDEILEAADGIMIARGDLGVELPAERVPLAQEQLILAARLCRKPVIVATQMLESMIGNARPTRAEVSDVANAVRAGADAIMLSGETAAGKYPIEAVQYMDMIARQTEGQQWTQGAFGGLRDPRDLQPPVPVDDGVAEAVGSLSRNLRARTIVVYSRRGRSIRVISASRPAAPIVGIAVGELAGALAHLLWGVLPYPLADARVGDEPQVAIAVAHELGLAATGHHVLLARGFSDDPAHNQPSITVLTA